MGAYNLMLKFRLFGLVCGNCHTSHSVDSIKYNVWCVEPESFESVLVMPHTPVTYSKSNRNVFCCCHYL